MTAMTAGKWIRRVARAYPHHAVTLRTNGPSGEAYLHLSGPLGDWSLWTQPECEDAILAAATEPQA